MLLLKMGGGLLVFGACAWFGFYRAHLLGRRVRWIRESMHGLQRLETEIAFAATPLVSALIKPSITGASKEDNFFTVLQKLLLKQVAERRSTSEVDIRLLWANVCAGRFYSLAAHHAELGIMRELGFSLGASDRDDQIKHLRLATQQLASLAETAQSEQQKYESMWRSLGVLGGSLLVVLMV